MNLQTIILLLGIHFISDWVLQPRWMARKKSMHLDICSLHGGIIGLCLFIGYVFISLIGTKFNWTFASFSIFVYMVTHVFQDWFIWRFYKKQRGSEVWFDDYWFYTMISIDQFLHLIILFTLTYINIDLR